MKRFFTNVVDSGVPRRDRPKLAKVSNKELKSGPIRFVIRRLRRVCFQV